MVLKSSHLLLVTNVVVLSSSHILLGTRGAVIGDAREFTSVVSN